VEFEISPTTHPLVAETSSTFSSSSQFASTAKSSGTSLYSGLEASSIKYPAPPSCCGSSGSALGQSRPVSQSLPY
ncbi:3676_t:CDS:2, partial [Gigaspora rosea]